MISVGRLVSELLPVRHDKGVLFTGSYPICPSHSMYRIYFLVIRRILNLGQCVAQYLIMTIHGQWVYLILYVKEGKRGRRHISKALATPYWKQQRSLWIWFLFVALLAVCLRLDIHILCADINYVHITKLSTSTYYNYNRWSRSLCDQKYKVRVVQIIHQIATSNSPPFINGVEWTSWRFFLIIPSSSTLFHVFLCHNGALYETRSCWLLSHRVKGNKEMVKAVKWRFIRENSADASKESGLDGSSSWLLGHMWKFCCGMFLFNRNPWIDWICTWKINWTG